MVYNIIEKGGAYFLLRWSWSCATASLVDWACCVRRVSFLGPSWISAAFSRSRSDRTELSSALMRSSYRRERGQLLVWANTERTLWAHTHTNKHTLCIRTLFCSSSAFRLSRLLKMRSFCSSLLVLLINLETAFLSASKCCQEPRVALRWWEKNSRTMSVGYTACTHKACRGKALHTAWPQRTDRLKEEWKKPSLSNWNNHHYTEEADHGTIHYGAMAAQAGVQSSLPTQHHSPSTQLSSNDAHEDPVGLRPTCDFNDSEAQSSPELNNSDGSSDLVIHNGSTAQSDSGRSSISATKMLIFWSIREQRYKYTSRSQDSQN